jgi:hypothetical protein
MLRVWMQDDVEPAPRHAERPGRWVSEDVWPSPRIEQVAHPLGDGTLGGHAARAVLRLRGSQICGLDSGAWCADGLSDDLPPDQRADDGFSLVFDSEPLDEPLEILGFPRVVLTLASDRQTALVAVRLCSVAPTGESLLVTRGLLNLTHRESHAHPEPLEPGRRYTVDVQLDSIAHRFGAGQRLRVAVSPTYWPLCWPSPEPVTLELVTGVESRLELPVRPPREADAALAPFAPPETPPPLETETLATGVGRRLIRRDLSSGRAELVFDWDLGGRYRLDAAGIESEDVATATYGIVEGEPLSARVDCVNTVSTTRGEWDTHAEARATMTCTADAFLVTTSLDAYEGGTRVWSRAWTFSFPRDLV